MEHGPHERHLHYVRCVPCVSHCLLATVDEEAIPVIFWTTWFFAIMAGFVALGAAIETPGRPWFWAGCAYFCAAFGVICSLMGVPL